MRNTILVLLAFGLLLGCGEPYRYEMHVGQNGTSYRLDKKTGRISFVDSSGVLPLEEPLGGKSLVKLKNELVESKAWPQLSIPIDNIKGDLRTSWRDGYLYYLFILTPVSQKIVDAAKQADKNFSFTIALKDKGGFHLAGTTMALTQFGVVNDKSGKPGGLIASSRFPLTMELYQALATWTLNWNLPQQQQVQSQVSSQPATP